MQRWHLSFLGIREIPPWLPEFEVKSFFTLTEDELAAVSNRRGTDHAFGLALQIGFLRMSGRVLNNVRIVPRPILIHLGAQLGREPPQVTSLRALYSRAMTLNEHQRLAMQLLGFVALGVHPERMLVAHLRRACPSSISPDELLLEARKWIYEHRYLIPSERRIRDIARHVVINSEAKLVKTFERSIPLTVRKRCYERLLERVPHAAHQSRLDWLQAAPRSRRGRSLDEAFMRVHFLYELGVHQYLQPDITFEKLRGYAHRLARTKTSRFSQLGAATKAVALMAFLRMALYQSTDCAVELWSLRVTDLKRQAHRRGLGRYSEALVHR